MRVPKKSQASSASASLCRKRVLQVALSRSAAPRAVFAPAVRACAVARCSLISSAAAQASARNWPTWLARCSPAAARDSAAACPAAFAQGLDLNLGGRAASQSRCRAEAKPRQCIRTLRQISHGYDQNLLMRFRDLRIPPPTQF